MNPNKISEAQAFLSGADLWVIKNDFNLKWWNDLDFRSGFLLSRCLFHNKIPIPSQITQLITETELPLFQLSPLSQCLVVGSSAHFLNKWILLWTESPEEVVAQIDQMIPALKIDSIRFFSDSDYLIKILTARLAISKNMSSEARPKVSLSHIEFIENT